jgi:hypothetical protein
VNLKALQGDLGACQFASEQICIAPVCRCVAAMEIHAADDERRWKLIQLLSYLNKKIPDIFVSRSRRMRRGLTFT